MYRRDNEVCQFTSYSEEYPYAQYIDFVDEEELNQYFARASAIVSLGELYRTAKGFFKK